MEPPDSDKENKKPTGKVDKGKQSKRKQVATPVHTAAAAPPDSNSLAEVLGPHQNQKDTFRRLAEQLRGTEETFRESIGAAAYLSNNLDLPVGTAVQELVTSFPTVTMPIAPENLEVCFSPPSLESMDVILEPVPEPRYLMNIFSRMAPPAMFTPDLPVPLPATGISNLLAPLVLERNPREKIGSLLERELQRPRADIERELSALARTDRDTSFNVTGYEFLFELERFLRNLIVDRILSPCRSEKEYQNHVPTAILEEWKERKAAEEMDPLLDGEYREIDYSDFTHLKMIFEKRNNRSKFLNILNQEQLNGIVTRLQDLDPIRKKIAHSRLLTEKEFLRLQLYSEDILKLFQKAVVDVW